MKKLVKGFTKFQHGIEIFSGILISVMTLIMFIQVVLRYFFNTGIPWVEEIALLCMVWYGFISISIGVLCKEHIFIEAFTSRLPQKVQKWIDKVNYLLIAAYGVFIIYYGIPISEYATRQTLPATGFPYSIVYIVLPISGVFFVIYSILVAAGISEKYPQFKFLDSQNNITESDSNKEVE